jgi:hypothetical protein
VIPLLTVVVLSLPADEVLKSFRPGDLTRRPVEGTALTEVLALRGRAGRWLERGGRLVPPSPEGAAELDPPSSQQQLERLVTLFEPGTVTDRPHAARLVAVLPGSPVRGGWVAERFVARTLEAGGAELVHLVLRFSEGRCSRTEAVLLRIAGAPTPVGPPSRKPVVPDEALTRFWAVINAPVK